MIFLKKYWWAIALVYFVGYLITYSVTTMVDKRDREKEKEEYGDDFFVTSEGGNGGYR